MSRLSQEYHFYDAASTSVRKAIGLYEMEKPLWAGSPQVLDQLQQTTDQLLEALVDDPEVQTVLEVFAISLFKAIEQICDYRTDQVDALTTNPITDIKSSTRATTQFYADLGIDELVVQEPELFRIHDEYPFSMMVSYRGEPAKLTRLLGLSTQLPPDATGSHFPSLGKDTRMHPKVILLFSRFPGWSSHERKMMLNQIQRHELRHLLDYYYHNPRPHSDMFERLKSKKLLELAGFVNSDIYQQSLVESSILYHFNEQERQRLPENWSADIRAILTGINNVAGEVRKSTLHQVLSQNRFWATLTSATQDMEAVATSLQEVQGLLTKHSP